MTGEKNRYKTLDKMWKLDDEQLKTPKHDEMVLYLLNEENLRKIPELPIRDAIEKNNKDKIKFKKRLDYLKDKVELDYETWKEKEGYSDYMVNKEMFLRDKSDCEKTYNNSLEKYQNWDGNVKMRIISEAPIKAPNGFLIGYWDLKILLLSKNLEVEYRFDHKESKLFEVIYIEVKPKITSFGATLRQLRTYESYIKEDKKQIYLFTEDLRFKDAFESQGIKVISPPERQSNLGE